MTHNKLISIIQNTHQHADSCTKEDDDEECIPPFVPSIIFDAQFLGEDVPSGFNAVRLFLDAGLKSDLCWDKEYQAAQKYIEQGLKIFWDVDLGLFNHGVWSNQPRLPLTNESQYLSLCLALEHFRNKLWKPFSNNSIGVCLYRGSANFAAHFIWGDQQEEDLKEWLKEIFTTTEHFVNATSLQVNDFKEINSALLGLNLQGNRLLSLYCRDVTGRYFQNLSDRLSDSTERYVLLDTHLITDPSLQILLSAKEGFPGCHLGIKGPLYNDNVLAWQGSSGYLGVLDRELKTVEPSVIRIGLCIPTAFEYLSADWNQLEKIIRNLKEKNLQFRIIPEVSLTTEWDGLDYIIVPIDHLGQQGRRKLQGFEAAGGIVLSTHLEINLDDIQ